MGWISLSKENKNIVLLNLLSTAIWYSYAFILRYLLISIKDYIMPTYIIHIGFAAAILILNILFSLFLNQGLNKKAEILAEIPLLEEFTFVDPPGYYTHPKYPYPICQNCLIKSKLISPVSQIDENTWFCNICIKYFPGGKGEVFTVDW